MSLESALKELKLEHFKTNDPLIRRDLFNAIHLTQKVINAKKTAQKRDERKAQREAQEQKAAVREALQRIAQKRAK